MLVRASVGALLMLLLSMAACTNGGDPGSAADRDPGAQPAAEIKPALTSLANTSLRFNGVYHNAQGRHHYFLRFFPEGNVVLINGPDTSSGQSLLRGLLKADTPNDPVQGIHNVPVEQRNDSLFFVTRPMRGEIDYSGVVIQGDSVRFLRYSHINGKRFLYTYAFEADPGS